MTGQAKTQSVLLFIQPFSKSRKLLKIHGSVGDRDATIGSELKHEHWSTRADEPDDLVTQVWILVRVGPPTSVF